MCCNVAREQLFRHATTEKYFSESCYSKPNLDCNYTFPNDLTPNGILFGAKSIGNVYIESKFSLIEQHSEYIFMCVRSASVRRAKSENDTKA